MKGEGGRVCPITNALVWSWLRERSYVARSSINMIACMPNYRKLTVWQRSYDLALAVYSASRLFPKTEQYGLTSQLQRAASSIPINIAEGCGPAGARELARFLRIARGSAHEVSCTLMLAHDLGYLQDEPFARLFGDSGQVGAMLTAWARTEERKAKR